MSITSRANPRVRNLRAALAGRVKGTLGVEGLHVVREAIQSGLGIRTLAVREDRKDVLDTLPGEPASVTLVLSEDAFASAANTEHAQGVAALVDVPDIPYVPRTEDLLVVADGIQDPGNLGTLIRSAEAFGAAAVALTQHTVSPWNGKCLRAAAGAAFRLPLPRWNEELLKGLREIGAHLYAAVARDGCPAHRVSFTGAVVLVVGNEGAGVSKTMLEVCDQQVTLTTPGPTESLNAAIAGSLLLYEVSQQRLRVFG